MAPFEKAFSHSKQAWLGSPVVQVDSVTKRHEMCFHKNVCGIWGQAVGSGGGGVKGRGGWTPFLFRRRRLCWGEMTFRSFCFWFRQSLLKWRHYARGRQWHPLLASHGNRETDWRQRLLTAADIINFYEETKPDWSSFSKRLIHKHMTRLEQPWMLCRHFPGK